MFGQAFNSQQQSQPQPQPTQVFGSQQQSQPQPQPTQVFGSQQQSQPQPQPQPTQVFGSQQPTSLFGTTTTQPNTPQDKHVVASCLQESKNIQYQILEQLKQLNEKNSRHTWDSMVHTGVSCDICRATNITGIRYKCLYCIDFDICESCEKRDCHNFDHPLIKIKNSNTFNISINK
jgi:hypothetical protein